MKHYDHIILGTGQATATLLGKLIPTKDSIAVIEGNKVGGSCVNYGCTPTKTLVACAKAIHQARRGAFYGFETGGSIKVDYPRVLERMNEVRNESSEGLTDWMESSENVELIRGWGKFVSNHVIEVNGKPLEGKTIYINTGTRPSAPPIAGLADTPWVDSAGLLDQKEMPKHLIILGGGYIGLEFAQVYNRFGAKVTVIQRNKEVMPKEDADVAKSIREVLEKEGVRIICGAETESVTQKKGEFVVDILVEGKSEQIVGDTFLVATGRKPNSDNLNLKATNIKTNERGFIEVNDYCQTIVEHVFAVGDVNGKGAFTHTAVNDAEIVLDHKFGGTRKLSDRITVYGLFTDPPLGRVGMSEKEAIASGKKVLKGTKPMETISRAKEMGETEGFAKLLVDAETDLILGAAIHGPGGDEIINMFAAIIHSGIPCKNYREVVLVHPTIAELMPWVLDGLELVE